MRVGARGWVRSAVLPLSLAAALVGLGSCNGGDPQPLPPLPNVGPGPGADGPQGAFYREHVKPILSANCYRCHAGFNHRGAFRMDSRGALLRGGTDGAVVVPGRPEDSLLVKLVRHEGPANHPMPMPPKKKLSDPDIAAITQWVRDGVTMPDEPK